MLENRWDDYNYRLAYDSNIFDPIRESTELDKVGELARRFAPGLANNYAIEGIPVEVKNDFRNPFLGRVNATTPRMPWQDIASAMYGHKSVSPLVQHFVQWEVVA